MNLAVITVQTRPYSWELTNLGTDNTNWIPIAQVAGIELGLSDQMHWARKVATGVAEFSPGSGLLWLMPVLDIKLPQVRALLKSGLKDAGLSPHLQREFPFRDLVLMALNWESDSWIWDGLSWAKHFRRDPEVVALLQKISKVSSARPKRARLRARRLLKQFGLEPEFFNKASSAVQ